MWSTNKAGENAVKATNVQLNGETDRSRAEFLRGEQLVLYSKVITAEQLLRDTEIQQWDAIHAYAFSGARKPNLKKLNTAYARWQNYDASIRIIGSTDVVNAFAVQAKHHWEFLEGVEPAIYYISCMRNPRIADNMAFKGKTDRATRIKCKERRQRHLNATLTLKDERLPKDRENFIKYARRDMGQ
jgi:hypothetical protein